MTIVERLAFALAASRSDQIQNWRDCCADALEIIARCQFLGAWPATARENLAANDP